ncbi:MAG TPA: DNA translocase FtsK 4TM domain-containing protein [Bryobacteraceae bacterium]|jgi:S-DNA-T family DNA segregation ATPase FtsK/SpoIIIE|nr:DNA translocase FtsK 4TM domain-containing protein [Bryobacteraceae bacterium]
MKLLSPTPQKRINELIGLLLLSLGLVLLLSLASYHVQDPSLNTAAATRPHNLIGYPGAWFSDLLLQGFGIGAFVFPLLLFGLAWKWVRSDEIEAGAIKISGTVMLLLSLTAAVSFAPRLALFSGTIPIGGLLGLLLAHYLVHALNTTGAILLTITTLIVSVYLVSTFTMSKLAVWFAGPLRFLGALAEAWNLWRAERRQRRAAKAQLRAAQKAEKRRRSRGTQPLEGPPIESFDPPVEVAAPEALQAPAEIPICALEEPPAAAADAPPWEIPAPVAPTHVAGPLAYRLPSTELLHEGQGRSPYDEQELKDIAVRIKSKFEEFNVLGSVVQINPGPVVTTFEFKPEAGIKYSRITTLTEDLCLGLQAESILIERIPGKPTVGIEVPNTKREVIALRQVLESDEFAQAQSRLTISMGKDINGRIKVASLESMPHLLIAGSTGSGKSVMINSMVMSILYKSTPDEVRMIMVDPKRVELGMYEGIPHLLTPVITDPKKATNALRNAVLEMDRRLRLLAEFGVRNIDQFNKKIRKKQEEPRNLFEEDEPTAEDLRPLPYILILIDELADLMMLEGRNVEESVTRLAQMARAVGMHLVLATQRPSVDVITGLIKANFPSRISFRVATRVDSRTVLDVMGAEHLLGKGDMLFLPPGSSRLIRVHGAFVTETEINRVVDFWKEQATPEYDQSFLVAPSEDAEPEGEEAAPGGQDPMYEDAVRIVLEMGKASTSTLQRRLRLGYGRAARILDMMQRDGIIGPPDGSKPREVLKRPDWLREVEDSVR